MSTLKTSAILLVEDNESDIALTRRAFRKNNIEHDLLVARDGEEAIRLLLPEDDHRRITPRLVLLDLKMPKIGGIEVLRRLRTDPRTRRLPVVVLTSSVEERDLGACYDAGTNSYIRKPVDFHEFSDAIRQLAQYWLVLNEQPPGADD